MTLDEKVNKMTKNMKKYDKAIFLTDEHIPYEDKQMVNIAEQYLAENDVKTRIHGGDLWDNPGMSSFDPDPRHYRETQDEIDQAVQYLNKLYKASPDTNVIIIPGNHDLSRLERTKELKPYGLKYLRSLDYANLLLESSRYQDLEIGNVKFKKDYTLANQALFFHGDSRMDKRIRGGVTGPRRTAEEHPFHGDLISGHKHQIIKAASRWRDRKFYSVGAMLDIDKVNYKTAHQYENGLLVVDYNSKARPRPIMKYQNVKLQDDGTMIIDGKEYKG